MKQWTERGLSGAKLVLVGMALILCTELALRAVQGHPLIAALVSMLFGVVGPILLVLGLYRIGTSHKRVKCKPFSDTHNCDS